MKIAVLSGKGGTGKTFVSVNLASVAPDATYIDCDVEEPNGHLFFKPEQVKTQVVTTKYPVFSKENCQGCRDCVNFCRFHALAYVGKAPMVFKDVCHSCGGCQLVCQHGAVIMGDRPVGTVETGTHNGVTVVSGRLHLGEASAVPVIGATLGVGQSKNTIIDCPPGSSCSVMESVSEVDYCILVVEPTAFGFHNFQMVHQLVSLLGKPCGLIINREEHGYQPLEDYCATHGLAVLSRIGYSSELAQIGAAAQIAVEKKMEFRQDFLRVWDRVSKEVSP